MEATDETSITEITIASDGRVFLFGLSVEVLELLGKIFPNDSAVMARLAQLNSQKDSRAEGLLENGTIDVPPSQTPV